MQEPTSPAEPQGGLSSLVNDLTIPRWAERNQSQLAKDEKVAHEVVQAENLSDGDSDNNEVAKVGDDDIDADFDEENFQRMIEKAKYANRYANFGGEEDEKQVNVLRRSSEAWGRRSITSNLMRRQSLRSISDAKTPPSHVALRTEDTVASDEKKPSILIGGKSPIAQFRPDLQ